MAFCCTSSGTSSGTSLVSGRREYTDAIVGRRSMNARSAVGDLACLCRACCRDERGLIGVFVHRTASVVGQATIPRFPTPAACFSFPFLTTVDNRIFAQVHLEGVVFAT